MLRFSMSRIAIRQNSIRHNRRTYKTRPVLSRPVLYGVTPFNIEFKEHFYPKKIEKTIASNHDCIVR